MGVVRNVPTFVPIVGTNLAALPIPMLWFKSVLGALARVSVRMTGPRYGEKTSRQRLRRTRLVEPHAAVYLEPPNSQTSSAADCW